MHIFDGGRGKGGLGYLPVKLVSVRYLKEIVFPGNQRLSNLQKLENGKYVSVRWTQKTYCKDLENVAFGREESFKENSLCGCNLDMGCFTIMYIIAFLLRFRLLQLKVIQSFWLAWKLFKKPKVPLALAVYD